VTELPIRGVRKEPSLRRCGGIRGGVRKTSCGHPDKGRDGFPRLEAGLFDPKTVDYIVGKATEEFRERLASWEALERKTATLLGFASAVLLLTLSFAPDAVGRAGEALASVARRYARLAELSLVVSVVFMGVALWPMTFPAPSPSAAINTGRLRADVEAYKAELAWGFKAAGARLKRVVVVKSWSLRLALCFMALALLALLGLGVAGLSGGR
jgi:hypothetical protein